MRNGMKGGKGMKEFYIRVTMFFCVLSVIVFSASGCEWENSQKTEEFELYGITYEYSPTLGGYQVAKINDIAELEGQNCLYIPDCVNGKQVLLLGKHKNRVAMVSQCSETERIYLPWSVFNSCKIIHEDSSRLRYVLSASNQYLVGNYLGIEPVENEQGRYVITRWLYDKETHEGSSYWQNEIQTHYLPANISFMFNYDNNPNEGYFFVDLVEESGKLMKPPYEPRRDGYTFQGWYKDVACTKAWDFENDTVTIQFDEEGNHIYEEIRLYAKWEAEEQ